MTRLSSKLVSRFAELNDVQPSKYGARRITVDGETFDSQREAHRYQELRLLERDGAISHLVRQPRYELQEGFVARYGGRQRPITYIADFAYVENGRRIAEDTKGFKTEVFKIKAKLFRHRYPTIELRITK